MGVKLLYLLSAVLFIFALKALASHKTARRGNLIGAIGMLVAIVATLTSRGLAWPWIVAGMVIGSAIGAFLALTVKMTAMPQMVAMFNGFGGLASGLVVLAVTIRGGGAIMERQMAITTALSTLIGWVTFTGSLVAFAKLQEFMISGRPIVFRLQKIANFGLLLLAVGLCVLWAIFPGWWALVFLLVLVAAALGIGFTIPIGGADMPVVISLLNSYSGLAACATGFVLANTGLIIAGALVGASGLILTRIMCVAMNRSLTNVLFGAVGSVISGPGEEPKPVTSWTPEDAVMCMENASRVVIVPGYGMAVAQAQHAIKELSDLLIGRGIDVKFGIHEVAGRMPGHMNVLLAEAEVPYERLCDRMTINPEFGHVDAVLVIGANDVVNPAARHDKGSPIFGMPILDVDRAGTVMVCKRTLNPGFAGIDNELFYQRNTAMIFGDAKKTVTEIVNILKSE